MRTQRWQLTVAVVLAGFAVSIQTSAAQSPAISLTIHLDNRVGVSPMTLADAEHVAKVIFRTAGVETQWIDWTRTGTLADKQSFSLSDVWIRIVPRTDKTLPSDVMGLAPGVGPDRKMVYVFYDGVERLAQKQLRARMKGLITTHASQAQILGHFMAHEIGHILLNLPSHHSTSGLMRGEWDLSDLQNAAFGCLLFTSEQAKAIRAEVARRGTRPLTAEVTGPQAPMLVR